MKVSITQKDIEKWSSRDFLLYFSRLMDKHYAQPLSIPSVAWRGFMARVKGFKEKLNLSNIEYKTFIDTVFDDFFKQDNYTPSFGTIVSEKVYGIMKSFNSARSSSTPAEKIDWMKYKRLLYGDSTVSSRKV